MAARIVRAWRALTTPAAARRIGPGVRTLVACSGGADSSALLLALRSASSDLVVGHVVHDLRPEAEAAADRDAVKELAQRLGLVFVERAVRVRAASGAAGGGSNLEARARAARYAALVEMAAEQGCAAVATAHHADDQLETILMRLVRGAGPRGLRAIAVRRCVRGPQGSVLVVRPMLGDLEGRTDPTRRREAEALCRRAGWVWREDATNADAAFLRNALRLRVTPLLEELQPGAAVRAARSAALVGQAQGLVRKAAGELWLRGKADGEGVVWARGVLRGAPPLVVGELLRRAVRRISGRTGRLSRRGLAGVVRAIRDESTEPRVFDVGGVRVRVTARAVRVGPSVVG